MYYVTAKRLNLPAAQRVSSQKPALHHRRVRVADG